MTRKEKIESAKDIVLCYLEQKAEHSHEHMMAFLHLCNEKNKEYIPHFKEIRKVMDEALKAMGETECG